MKRTLISGSTWKGESRMGSAVVVTSVCVCVCVCMLAEPSTLIQCTHLGHLIEKVCKASPAFLWSVDGAEPVTHLGGGGVRDGDTGQ